jgi:L-fuconolactonase
MPNHPIVDTHVHLWNPEKLRLPWLDGIDTLNKRFDIDTYQEHTRGLNIEAMVYAEVDVAPHYTLIETIAVEDRIKLEPRIKGIIAHAPVRDGGPLRAYLTALKAVGPHVRGIRSLIQGINQPGYVLQPGYLTGVQMLAEFDYSFDICIRHQQLPDAIELVKRCPQVRFILDHIAKPDVKSGLLDPWRANIKALAALPNITCKISGMVTEGDLGSWTLEGLQPYFDHIVECFGEQRVMYGGDWPVVLLGSSYLRWVDTVDAMVARRGLSDAAQRLLWNENAKRVYRLE